MKIQLPTPPLTKAEKEKGKFVAFTTPGYLIDIEAVDVRVSVGVLRQLRIWLSVTPKMARRIAAALNKAADKAEENARS
jgi:hypothetical protein